MLIRRNERRNTVIVITNHSFPIRNLTVTSATVKVQRVETALKTRGTVISVLYRKWRCRQSNRSTETAAKVNKETADVSQENIVTNVLNVQYAVRFLRLISAIFKATKRG